MQLNQGKFLQNGACGYVLRPEFMYDSKYVPNDPSVVPSSLTILIGVNIMAARYLNRKSGRGMVSPYVEVEICGADYDNNKFKTKTITDNGFNPYWNDTFDFQITNPDLALLRFVVYDVDIFGDSNFIGQYTVPVRCIRTGYRSIPLKNAFSEDLELSGTLCSTHTTGNAEIYIRQFVFPQTLGLGRLTDLKAQKFTIKVIIFLHSNIWLHFVKNLRSK